MNEPTTPTTIERTERTRLRVIAALIVITTTITILVLLSYQYKNPCWPDPYFEGQNIHPTPMSCLGKEPTLEHTPTQNTRTRP